VNLNDVNAAEITGLSTLQTGSADAFNNEGWGRLSWNSLVWGQDFEDITIQVTTPGKSNKFGVMMFGVMQNGVKSQE
jgi:hypothetical protein